MPASHPRSAPRESVPPQHNRPISKKDFASKTPSDTLWTIKVLAAQDELSFWIDIPTVSFAKARNNNKPLTRHQHVLTLSSSTPTARCWNSHFFSQYSISSLSPQQSALSSHALCKQVHHTIKWELFDNPTSFFFILRLQITSQSLPIHFPFRFSLHVRSERTTPDLTQRWWPEDDYVPVCVPEYLFCAVVAATQTATGTRHVVLPKRLRLTCTSFVLPIPFSFYPIDALRKYEEYFMLSFTEKSCCPLQTTADDCRHRHYYVVLLS
jgi:hypothetical protein